MITTHCTSSLSLERRWDHQPSPQPDRARASSGGSISAIEYPPLLEVTDFDLHTPSSSLQTTIVLFIFVRIQLQVSRCLSTDRNHGDVKQSPDKRAATKCNNLQTRRSGQGNLELLLVRAPVHSCYYTASLAPSSGLQDILSSDNGQQMVFDRRGAAPCPELGVCRDREAGEAQCRAQGRC